MASHRRAYLGVGCFKIVHSSFHCLFRVAGIPLRSWFLTCPNTWSGRKKWAAICWFLFILKICSGLLLPPTAVLQANVPRSPVCIWWFSGCCTFSEKKIHWKRSKWWWNKKKRQKASWVQQLGSSLANFVMQTAAVYTSTACFWNRQLRKTNPRKAELFYERATVWVNVDTEGASVVIKLFFITTVIFV